MTVGANTIAAGVGLFGTALNNQSIFCVRYFQKLSFSVTGRSAVLQMGS